MRVKAILKTMVYLGFVTVSAGMLTGAMPVRSHVNGDTPRTHVTTAHIRRGSTATITSCSTPSGIVVFPDCEVWVTMSTSDTASVEFFANNDTSTPTFMGVSSDCDGTYFSGCESTPNSWYLIANGGGADFMFKMTSKGATGSTDVHVRFDATNVGEYVTATIHVTIQ